jgi:hypothetical protein
MGVLTKYMNFLISDLLDQIKQCEARAVQSCNRAITIDPGNTDSLTLISRNPFEINKIHFTETRAVSIGVNFRIFYHLLNFFGTTRSSKW